LKAYSACTRIIVFEAVEPELDFPAWRYRFGSVKPAVQWERWFAVVSSMIDPVVR
jgi:hypothetical protein